MSGLKSIARFSIYQDRLALEVTKVSEHCALSDFQTTSRSITNKPPWPLSGSLCVKFRPFGESSDLCVTSVTF